MITREDVKTIAMLAKLEVKDNELESFTEDFKKIVEFADTIGKAELSDDENADVIAEIENRFREDEIKESFNREEILSNAKDTSSGFFVLRKRA